MAKKQESYNSPRKRLYIPADIRALGSAGATVVGYITKEYHKRIAVCQNWSGRKK